MLQLSYEGGGSDRRGGFHRTPSTHFVPKKIEVCVSAVTGNAVFSQCFVPVVFLNKKY